MLVAMGDNAVKCQLFDMLPQLHCQLLLSIPPYRHTATECCGAQGGYVALWRGAVAWRCAHERGFGGHEGGVGGHKGGMSRTREWRT
jgi:hypothetical protein